MQWLGGEKNREKVLLTPLTDISGLRHVATVTFRPVCFLRNYAKEKQSPSGKCVMWKEIQ